MRPDELSKLKEQRLELVQELRTHTAAADETVNGGDWTGEDEEKFKRLEDEILKVNRKLERAYREESLVRFAPEQLVIQDSNGAATSFQEYRGRQAAMREYDLPEVREAIYSWIMRGREGMDADEFRVLSKAASGGGYFVPTELADMVVRALRFLPGGVASLGRTLVTSTGDIFNIPLNLTHGTAAWIAESGSYTPSDETMTQGILSAYKAGTKIIVSEELLTDSAFDLPSFITTEFGERIGALAEAAYISGDGSGKPTGILNGAVVTRVNLAAGQVATTTWAGLAPALFSVPAQYRDGQALLVSDSLWVRLATIVDSTGRPIWQPSAAAGMPDTVSGIPIYTHPNLAAIGASTESGIVGNFTRGYWIRRVDGVYMQRQNELHSDSGQVGFRAYLRLDGNVVLPDALRVIKFAAT